ncbi:alpha/beta hydrolase [Pleionea sp. CnH1-48]|uniref:alpha/beta hydrolase n=1 Tax=Pleionea sp. CnH1-48 TaxID=2954494 RepID=UPI002096CCEB|nr:alpha/beta hydrolase [Pleionea sp. CnH1-48]MCO7227273.1 alpha/beta hydrolase [Pleionea sp. CnH1-48]
MKRIAIAIIHGMSTEEQFYSVELKHRIIEEYIAGGDGRLEDDLMFHEIYWADAIKEELSSFYGKINYKGDLAYDGLRQMFIDYLGSGLAYHDGSRLYTQVQNRVADSLKKFAGHRRVKEEKTPLVVLAHSFGSIIIQDYIRNMRDAESHGVSPFEAMETLAGFVTFGSPLAIYARHNEDLHSPIKVAGDALPDDFKKRTRWLNFYDKDDVVAYPLKGMNEEYNEAVHGDYEINVGSAATSWNPACHNGYWEDKDFYKPVARLLGDLLQPHDIWK